MDILGISAFYHDSAACLVRDGEIFAAAQEERFSRKKHDYRWPQNAIEYCLKEGGLKGSELDYVVFYDKPFLKFERLLESYLTYAPKGFASFLKAMPIWLKQKLWMKYFISKELDFEGKILFPEHHESHAASAFYPSPFQEAAFITTDGVGEWTTTSFGMGRDNALEIMAEIKFPHSLGLLYSAFTYYTGFKVNSGEYKIMGLAPYGEPKYVQAILDNLVDLKEDGSFKLNQKYFNYSVGLTMTNRKFNKLFGGLPRKPETLLTQKQMDLARSVQVVTEEVMMRMARHVRKETGMKNLCLAGGVALNCVANGILLREKVFDRIWIQPAAGDAGGALGAALYVWYRYLGNPRKANPEKDMQSGSYLGPVFSDDEIQKYIDDNKIPHRRVSDGELPQLVAEILTRGKVVGWFNGRMEFGPRALGSRSIIGDARSKEMQSLMNLKIKFRESFRPFAPSILRERVSNYFEMEVESPYMLLVAPIKEDKRVPMTEEQQKLFGIDKLNVPRSEVPAITHIDYSARVQTVSREDNPEYYDMIGKFEEMTGCPVIINTSFNVRGEPIVCSPAHAYLCFMRTNMDYLVMGNFILDKKDQPELKGDTDWRKEFELD
ncbi:MAG: carbamoyltransferase [candidate division Zixibacteria bacterium]|nr:carbamoyltransferase [Candidatus Tariuqbacter arcticus]